MNPYLAGALLGVVLFLSFYVTGHGLGASGGVARTVTAGLKGIVPQQVDTWSFFANLGGGAKAPLHHWITWEILGVLIGGLVSGLLARRVRFELPRGPAIGRGLRIALALGGGLLAGWATQLSRGCTSGQALSGGATLAAGSWAFMFAVFAGAYAVAYPLRRLWR
ncbi:MAG: YeeE/YedE family protein [Polyangiaceae bacterium]|nr:YeeE/YedE family protein [Polyangiaceae bacterium]